MELKEALETCAEMWYWLSDNPGRSKITAVTELELGHLENECAMCEYAIHAMREHNSWSKNQHHMCYFCPMWPSYKWGGEYACQYSPASDYRKWRLARDHGEESLESEYAKSIAEYATALLEDLNAEPERRNV